jgi:osmotically-inducible protein OsmY
MNTQVKDKVIERDVGMVFPANLVAEELIKEHFAIKSESQEQLSQAINSGKNSKLQDHITPAGPAKSDAELVKEVAQALANRAGIKNPLIIRAYKGVITLRGQVDTAADLDLAEGATLSIPGVKGVINGQTVKAESTAALPGPENQVLGSAYSPLASSPSHIPGWTLPVGGPAILAGAEVFARDGRVGRVRGIGLRGPKMEVACLIIEKPEFIFKSRRFLPFEYIEGSYFVGNPAIFLKVNHSQFNEITKVTDGAVRSNANLFDKGQIEERIFDTKTPIYFLGRKLGWLGGVLLDRQKSTDPTAYKISHYILKTSHDSKLLLLPVEAVEKRAGDGALHLLPNRGELLMHPEQFNGFSKPNLVVERTLEKLAWSAQMQHWGGRLRVEYRKGEVFLEGAMPDSAKLQQLIEIVESVPGVRRVHNLIKVRT